MVLLACPACTFSNPIFLVLSTVVGSVTVSVLLLRPFVRGVKRLWGWPRIDGGRLTSLMLLLSWLVPLWFLGRQNYSALRASVCVAGVSACLSYLWVRFCWLLEEHGVRTMGREILFPGILGPVAMLLGTIVGTWMLGTLLVAPVWPMILVPLTMWSAVFGVPLAFLVVYGLRYTFGVQGKGNGESVPETPEANQAP